MSIMQKALVTFGGFLRQLSRPFVHTGQISGICYTFDQA
ncbi:hypothetical protein TPY_1882 [Sulfobacillus acidophilus TPY]|nr:hypothetical protein TPY_1882 [Sulfobacillus acidophilus TPY]